ncbi:MAG: hypothetical protein HYS12_24160 [Planctomycetes bacterium]|nr:hypothetical protein [Planctomycetota bacterium]
MRRSRYFWVAVAAGLALTSLAAPPAHASCGHYIIIGNSRPELPPDKAKPDPSSPGPAENGREAPAPARPAPPPPCSGPNCSENPQPLPSPPPKTTPVEEQRWGHNSLQTLPPQGDHNFLLLPQSAARPVRGACSIYHPPR